MIAIAPITTTEQALLRDVLEHPWDDLPRLIYADRLEESGQGERAEFIRVQCELVYVRCVYDNPSWEKSRTHPVGTCRRCDMYRRESELFALGVGQDQLPEGISLKFKWQRGFVSHIECTLSEFMGGACECVSSRRDLQGFIDRTVAELYLTNFPAPAISLGDPCPACKGTGRIPGLVDTIFAEHTVTEVVLTDRIPDYEEGTQAFWMSDDHPDHEETWQSWLPPAIYDLLDGFNELDDEEGLRWKVYPTRELALAALSRACVTYGRKRAGLSQLPTCK
jgi:uncharacterized protein (TIGR02996 family)